jgi:hypothetical protein
MTLNTQQSMPHTKESQCKMILAHLKKHRSIMPLQALNLYGIYRLGARIFDLRNDGHKIETQMIHEHPVKFAKYILK